MRCTVKYLFVLASLLLMGCTLSSCILEDLSDCPRPFGVRVRALDADNIDITASGEIGSATVLAFDESGRKVARFVLSAADIVNNKPIHLDNYKYKSFTFVACANASPKMEEWLENVDQLNEVKWQLTSTAGVAEFAPHLYFGSLNVSVLYGDVTHDTDKVIDIFPKTTRVNLVVKGYKQWLEAQESIHSTSIAAPLKAGAIAIGLTPDTYNARGELVGDLVKYHPSGEIQDNGDFASLFAIYPTLESKPIDVTFFALGSEVLKINTSSDGEPLVPIVGRTLNILIDLRFAYTSVVVVVTPWNEVHQFVEF